MKLHTCFFVFISVLVFGTVQAQKDNATVYDQLHAINVYWSDHSNSDPLLAEAALPFSDTELIQLHLTLVEKTLRKVDVSNLSESQKANRTKALDDLKKYAAAGSFPKNLFYAERTPFFIDQEGTACAVGQLIIASGNTDLALDISKKYNENFLKEMPTNTYSNWAKKHGFTFEELAWIQPTYGGGYFPCNTCPVGSYMDPSCPGSMDGCIGLPDLSWAVTPISYLPSCQSCNWCALGPGGYSLTVTDATGTSVIYNWTLTSTDWSTTIQKTEASCNALCDGEIIVNETGATPPYFYTWTPNVSNSNTASNLCAGIYNCVLTDANGCQTVTQDTIFEPAALPTLAFSSDTTINQGDSVVLCVSGSDLSPFTFLWNTGETTPCIMVSPDSTTLYSVTVSDSCTAGQTQEMEVAVNSIPDGISDVLPIQNLRLSPNPSSGDVSLQFNATASGKMDVRLVDPSGRIVLEKEFVVPLGKQTLQIPISEEHILPGVYFLQLRAQNWSTTKRLIHID